MLDRLNFFAPFRRLPPNHENQLTRALLVVLRYSPMAHAAWLGLLGEQRRLHELPRASFRTQQRRIRIAADDGSEARLTSVFLAPETPLSDDEVIVEDDRSQVLDAVIDYGQELFVVIENKVAEADDLQSRRLNISGAGVNIDQAQVRVVVLWRDVIEAFAALQERDLLDGAEAMLVDDFMLFLEEHFPSLGPFSRLRRCGREYGRMERRLRQILAEASSGPADWSNYRPRVPLSSSVAASIFLGVDSEARRIVEVSCFPADTLGQARALFKTTGTVEKLRELAERLEWSVLPNFHFGFASPNLCYLHGDIEIQDYLTLWQQRISAGEGAVQREDWDQYWRDLLAHGVARPDDRAEFDQHFTDTGRSSASPRPGIWIKRNWSIEEAETLDDADLLVEAVRDAISVILTSLDATIDRTGAEV